MERAGLSCLCKTILTLVMPENSVQTVVWELAHTSANLIKIETKQSQSSYIMQKGTKRFPGWDYYEDTDHREFLKFYETISEW